MSDESKSDDNSPVKPQVIDLQAEDVTVEADPPREEQAAPPPPQSPPRRKASGTATWIIAALLLGVIGGGWLYRDLLSTYLPTDEMTALTLRIAVLEANGKTQGEQLLAVSQSSDAASALASSLDTALKDVAAGVADVQSRIGSFETRIAESEKALQSAKADLDALRTAVSSGASSGAGPVDSAALAAISQRIDALEKDMASLKSRGGTGDVATATAALSQALADIKAKIASGVAFAAEYDRLARMVPAAAGLDVLATHASAGLPDAAGLGAELRAQIPALPKPTTETAPPGDSYWDSIRSALSGIITIRDIGEADWPALAEKAAAFAEAGDLPQAIALIDAAEGAKPSPISQWRDRAAARLKLEAALDSVSQAVLRQIAALGGAQ